MTCSSNIFFSLVSGVSSFSTDHEYVDGTSKSEREKTHTVQNLDKNRRQYRTQALVQFSSSASPMLGTTENATFVHCMKKSM